MVRSSTAIAVRISKCLNALARFVRMRDLGIEPVRTRKCGYRSRRVNHSADTAVAVADEKFETLVRILWGAVTSGAMLLSNRPRLPGVVNIPLGLHRWDSNPRGDGSVASEGAAPFTRLRGLL